MGSFLSVFAALVAALLLTAPTSAARGDFADHPPIERVSSPRNMSVAANLDCRTYCVTWDKKCVRLRGQIPACCAQTGSYCRGRHY